MKIVSWNVNGIRAVHKKGLFEPFVKKLNPDIICLQETKAEQGQSEVDLKGYEEFWNSSKTKKGYSGTAIFTKIKPLSVSLDFPPEITKKYKLEDKYGDPNAEGRVVTAEFKDFYLVNVYTPNAKDDLTRVPLRYNGWDTERLMNDAGIIRNRLKISAAIYNAQQLLLIQKEFGSFRTWLDVHAKVLCQEKSAWLKLFKKHFKFVGGEIVGEFLMSIGLLDGSHGVECKYARIR
jgi:hypothetical protein